MQKTLSFSLQQKAREEREAKRSMIDFRHEYLISTVASTLGLTNEEVTESLLEGTQVSLTLSKSATHPSMHPPIHLLKFTACTVYGPFSYQLHQSTVISMFHCLAIVYKAP